MIIYVFMRRAVSPLGPNGLLCLDPTQAIAVLLAKESSIVMPTSHFNRKMKFFNQLGLGRHCTVPGYTQPDPPHPPMGLSPSEARGVWNLLDGFIAGALTEDQQSGSGTHQQVPRLQALDSRYSLMGERKH